MEKEPVPRIGITTMSRAIPSGLTIQIYEILEIILSKGIGMNSKIKAKQQDYVSTLALRRKHNNIPNLDTA